MCPVTHSKKLFDGQASLPQFFDLFDAGADPLPGHLTTTEPVELHPRKTPRAHPLGHALGHIRFHSPSAASASVRSQPNLPLASIGVAVPHSWPYHLPASASNEGHPSLAAGPPIFATRLRLIFRPTKPLDFLLHQIP